MAKGGGGRREVSWREGWERMGDGGRRKKITHGEGRRARKGSGRKGRRESPRALGYLV